MDDNDSKETLDKKLKVSNNDEDDNEDDDEDDDDEDDEEDEDDDEDDDDDDDDDDDEDEDDDDDDVRERARDTGRKRLKKKRRNTFVDDEAEEDGDDSEDEDDEDEPVRRKKKKRRRGGASEFVDDMAMVGGGDDDDDDENDDFVDGDGAKESDLRDLQTEMENRRAVRGLQNRLQDDEDVMRIAQRYDEQYTNYGLDELEEADFVGLSATDAVSRQSLLPSVSDPSMWSVKVKPGTEREVVVALMRKMAAMKRQNQPVSVFAVLTQDHLSGVIYVEAKREQHVIDLVNGTRNVFWSKRKLVPLKEMPDVMAVSKRGAALEKGAWVRITRGPYKGDLAQCVVPNWDDLGQKARIRLVPRVSLTGEKSKKRLNPRFMTAEYMRSHDVRLEFQNDQETGKTIYSFGSHLFDEEGYELKIMSLKSFSWTTVLPTLDEIQFYQSGMNNMSANKNDVDDDSDLDDEDRAKRNRSNDNSTSVDVQALLAAAPRKKTTFRKGDNIRVVSGELVGITGQVVATTDEHVTIKADIEEITDLLDIPVEDVQKNFKTGNHVKVSGGEFDGETGLVIAVDNDGSLLTVFSDRTMKEFRVLARDVALAVEVATGRMALAGFELFDMVMLPDNTIGVIVKVEADGFRVLDTKNEEKAVPLSGIGNKRNRRFASSNDAHHNSLQLNDNVEVLDGLHKGRKGVIKHIHRYFAFVHSKEVLENNGLFCARTGQLYLQGGRQQATNKANNNAGAMVSPQSPRSWAASNVVPGSFSGNSNVGGGGRSRDPLLGQRVVITTPLLKGFVAKVLAATDSTVKVKLEHNRKTTSVPRNQVIEYAMSRRAKEANTRWGSNNSSSGGSGAGGDFGRTPARGSQTPARDTSMTPMRTIGTPGRDESWNPQASNTPFRPSTPSTGLLSDAFAPRQANAFTPGTSFTPQTTSTFTPGGGFTPMESPYPHTHTGGVFMPTTPGGGLTPHGMTPVGYTPHTGMETPYTPAGGVLPPADSGVGWRLAGVDVQDFHDNRLGYLVDVDLSADRGTLNNGSSVSLSEVLPSIPKKRDRVRISAGEYAGRTGAFVQVVCTSRTVAGCAQDAANNTIHHTCIHRFVGVAGQLIGVDGTDGIVKLDDLDIKILDMASLIVWSDPMNR